MKKMCTRLACALLAAVLCMLAVFPALAAGEARRVYDEAGLFSASEAEALEQELSAFREKHQLDFVVATIRNAQGKSTQDYADDYYDENGFGVGEDASGILYLIDMDNREIYLSTTGRMIDYMTDSRIDRALDAAYSEVSNGQYAQSALKVVKSVAQSVSAGVPAGHSRYDTQTGKYTKTHTWGLSWKIWLAFSVASVLIGVAVFFAIRKRYATGDTAYVYPLLEKSALQLQVNQDVFVNQNVTHRRIETDTSTHSGGRVSSTHTSSSGRTHGGGGRKF